MFYELTWMWQTLFRDISYLVGLWGLFEIGQQLLGVKQHFFKNILPSLCLISHHSQPTAVSHQDFIRKCIKISSKKLYTHDTTISGSEMTAQSIR